jgi:hypothetical protein
MILQRAFAQVDISIDFSMAYFDHDFHNGIDGFMKHKNNRIGVDLTHIRHVPNKIHNQSRIKEDYERLLHIQGKRSCMPHNYGRVVVGLSTRLYGLSRAIVSSSDCVNDVTAKIQEIRQFPGLNDTEIIGLNKK